MTGRLPAPPPVIRAPRAFLPPPGGPTAAGPLPLPFQERPA